MRPTTRMPTWACLAWLIATAGCSIDIATHTRLTPTALRCEYRVNPLGIDVAAPRLSWIVESAARAQKQTAYRILVAGSEELLADDSGDLWDTGRVASDETAQIAYAGAPLPSRARCYWKVQVWDKHGASSTWSAPAFWTMGLLDAAAWRADWIGHDTDALNEDPELHLPPAARLRREWALSRPVRRATAYVTALGLFELSLNGRRVGRDVFTPGWTDYATRVYYMTYDVTDYLRDGKNAITATLAGGWYAGYVGFELMQARRAEQPVTTTTGRAYYGQRPAFRAQLEVEYVDGTTDVIATDETWRAAAGPIRQADLLMGETHDARLETPGWDRPGFDDAAWAPAENMGSYAGLVEAFPGNPVRETSVLEPTEVTEPQPGVFIFNLGQNFAGRARLKVAGPAGTKVVLRFGEMLNDDGTLMTENLRGARATDTYILRGTGQAEIWEPRFTFHGFQYVEITGYPGRPGPDAVTGVALNSDAPVAGAFECSNAMVNQLYSNITWTQRANFLDIPTDCPQRDERLGWTGDAQMYIRSATYNMDVGAFMTKWLVALNDDQWDTGAYPNWAPLHSKRPGNSPGWSDAGIVCPWTIWQVYGDTRVIERHYDNMQRFMRFYEQTSAGYLRAPEVGYGDWLSIDAPTPKDLIATAYFAHTADLMAQMAAAIGREADAARYADLFANVKTAFNEKYVTKDGRIEGDTQTCYAMALSMDLLPEALRSRAAAHLVRRIEERGGGLSTGFLGLRPLLPTLTATGYPDVAFQLLTNTEYPSWGYSVVNGATSIWERWNSYTKDYGFTPPSGGFSSSAMNSFSHYTFGSVCEWMFADMAGIDTDGPGYRRLHMRPHAGGGITHVRASYQSIRGRIATEWTAADGRFHYTVTIPANVTATVFLPGADSRAVTESDGPATAAEGVEWLRTEGDRTVWAVGSGTYRFIVESPEP